MSKYNHWNYKELGFNSESEMNDSITRVQRKMKMNRDELVRAKKKEAFARREQAFSFEAMEEGVRLERLDSKVFQLIRDEQHQAKMKAEQEESRKFMKAFNEHIKEDNERKAQQEYEEQKEQAEVELQKEIYSKHNVKTEEEQKRDEGLKGLLTNVLEKH